MIVKAFCMAGGHSVTISEDGNLESPQEVPKGWSSMPADVVRRENVDPLAPWQPSIWYYKADADAVVLVCPEHVDSMFDNIPKPVEA